MNADDITHYHRIIVALNETIRIMVEIDKVIEVYGGWPGAFVRVGGRAYQAEAEIPLAAESHDKYGDDNE